MHVFMPKIFSEREPYCGLCGGWRRGIISSTLLIPVIYSLTRDNKHSHDKGTTGAVNVAMLALPARWRCAVNIGHVK